MSEQLGLDFTFIGAQIVRLKTTRKPARTPNAHCQILAFPPSRDARLVNLTADLMLKNANDAAARAAVWAECIAGICERLIQSHHTHDGIIFELNCFRVAVQLRMHALVAEKYVTAPRSAS